VGLSLSSVSMDFSSKKWIPCVLYCCLLFFAVTADSVSCSVVTGGYDGNRPPVTIEHKFVSHTSSVGMLTKDAPNSVQALTSMTVEPLHSALILSAMAVVNPLETASLPIFAPLRC
jgi:hypothetical protein